MRRCFVALVVALSFLPGAPVHALDPQRAPSQYVVAKWGATLPSPTVHDLVQTPDHHLWLGTAVGLVRFDGAGFVVFNAANSPGFGDGGVSRLAAGRDGTLYVGTTAGAVLQYRAGVFTPLDVPRGTAYVSSLLAARDGGLWIGLPGHDVQRWEGGHVSAFPDLHGIQAPLAMVEGEKGGIWIGTRVQGLLRGEGGAFKRGLPTTDTIQALCLDRTGALWIGTPHGLLRLKGSTVDRFTRADGLPSDDVSALLEDRDGNIWVGTAGAGLCRWAGGRWARLTTAEGLSDDDVRSLLEDHEGNLWVGTSDGLNCISDGRFITYGRFEGLGEPAVSAIAPAHDGGVWLGMASGRISRLRDGQVKSYQLPTGLGREYAIALHEARDGSLWIAQDNARVFRLKDGVVSEHTPLALDEAEWKVRLIAEDEGGVFFMVSVLGPARIEERHLVPILPAPPRHAFLRYTHAVYEASDGVRWFCDLRGLARRGADGWRMFTTHEGLPQNRVRSASLEPDGAVWAATSGGLAYVKDDKVRSVTVKEGLPEDWLRLVLDDGLGHLWVASMGHIFRLDKRELLDLFAGKIARVRPLLFDATDGLRTTEGLLSNGPGFRAADGRLWFATSRGVSVIDPKRLSTDDPAPEVTIERIRVDRTAPSSPPGDTGPVSYEPGRGEVTIDYTALGFRAPGRLRFRHRLEGLDSDWVDAGTERRAYYSSLAPGHYRFSVDVSNRDGLWNGRAASFAFTIRPPFYRTPLFFAGCAALVAALGLAAHRFRVKQVRARLAAVIQERTRIARELHDTLAQGLAGVKLHIETALSTMADKPEVARASMDCARSITTSSMGEVRRSIWVLRTQAAAGEADFAAGLKDSLTQLSAESEVMSIVEVTGHPRRLPLEVERNILRIAHEAVTNVLRHAQARTLAIELAFEDDAVRLRVRDDGRGFDPARYLSGPQGDHFGLLGIRERTHSLGGELQVWSRPTEGTEITCRLPYDGRAEGHAEWPTEKGLS
jgi:signal transduction histidine kinase/ligand-binding sensor domain-containing protein